MKLHILSDLHLEFYPLEIPPTDADVIVLAGDIGSHTHGVKWAIDTLGPLGKPILYCSGNHEAYGAEWHGLVKEMKRLAEMARAQGVELWVLENDEVVVDGVRFLGCTLWTDYTLYGTGDRQAAAMNIAHRGMNDHRLIRCAPMDRFTPSQALALHRHSTAWLSERLATPFDGKTVVLTHHLPSEQSVAQKYKGDALSPAFASRLEHLVRKANLWVHGHTHERMAYHLGDDPERGHVICNPRGYVGMRAWGLVEENPGFNAGLVVSV